MTFQPWKNSFRFSFVPCRLRIILARRSKRLWDPCSASIAGSSSTARSLSQCIRNSWWPAEGGASADPCSGVIRGGIQRRFRARSRARTRPHPGVLCASGLGAARHRAGSSGGLRDGNPGRRVPLGGTGGNPGGRTAVRFLRLHRRGALRDPAGQRTGFARRSDGQAPDRSISDLFSPNISV